MKRAWLGLVLLVVIVGGAFFLVRQRPKVIGQHKSDKLAVVASFYPLAEFARQVGGEAVEVITVVPADQEPHEYEPTPLEVASVYKARVFIYNGSGLDPWAERIAPEAERAGVRVLNVSEQMTGGERDPHFWLDPVLAQKEVQLIAEALAGVDPDRGTQYQSRSEAYQAQLHQLDTEYREGLAACGRRDIVTSHAAFGYLAKRYNLSVINIAGLSPEEEPSARRISDITQLAHDKNIHFIFFETLVSPKLAQTVAQEIGAQTLVFNPLEGLTVHERQAENDYLSVMRSNLQNLRRALECR